MGKKLEKVWVESIFGGRYKGIVIKRAGRLVTVQLVGYPFGSYPNGKDVISPESRLSPREDEIDLSRTVPKCKHGHTKEAHPNCFKCAVCGQKKAINAGER